jgi:biopolymer transport protein TolR
MVVTGLNKIKTTVAPCLLEQLTESLLVHQQKNPELQVLINGDTQVPYGEVVKLMASLQQAQILRVGLLTEPSETH